MDITKENIEALLLDYAEGNLDEQSADALEQFLVNNPQYKELLNDYDPSLRVTDDVQEHFDRKNLLFADKMRLHNRLVRITRPTKYIKHALVYSTGIAAVMILCFIFIKPQSHQTERPLAKTSQPVKSIQCNSEEVKQPSTEVKSDIAEVNELSASVKRQDIEKNNPSTTAKEQYDGQERRNDEVIRHKNTVSEPLQQLIWLAENQWRDSDKKILRKDGNELRIIYVNDDNTVRGSVDAQMMDYPDNTVIRYINNTPQSANSQYRNAESNRFRETVIHDVTLEELDYIMRVLQNR